LQEGIFACGAILDARTRERQYQDPSASIVGIRDIERKIKLKEAMAKKAAELKTQELESKARVQDFTAGKIRDIAEKHGFILAINDEITAEIGELRLKYGIPESRVLKKIVKKDELFDEKGKLDPGKLGWFLFQEVLGQKEETGGIFTIPELYLFLRPFDLAEKINMKDIQKAMQAMVKSNAIAGYETLASGVDVVYFFDEKFTSDYKTVLSLAKQKGVVLLEDLLGMRWSQQRAEKTLESLVRSGIARFDESYMKGKKWYFPGLK
jgi:hypothetical protein